MFHCFRILTGIALFLGAARAQQPQHAITLPDIMKFMQIRETAISPDGKWVGVTTAPDRGNKELRIINTATSEVLVFPNGESPEFSANSNFCSFFIQPDFRAIELKKDNPPQPSVFVLNLDSRDTLRIRNAGKPFFSKDSKWILTQVQKTDSGKSSLKDKSKPLFMPKTLILHSLQTGISRSIENTLEYGIDSSSSFLAYSVADTTRKIHALFLRNLKNDSSDVVIDSGGGYYFGNLMWNSKSRFSFTRANQKNSTEMLPAVLMCWDGEVSVLDSGPSHGWLIPFKNRVKWSSDNLRLFYCYQMCDTMKKPLPYDTTADNTFNVDSILTKAELDVWHWDDPYIKTHEKKRFKDNKSPLFTQMYDFQTGKKVRLADSLITDVIHNNGLSVLGYTNIPYRKEVTWDDYYYDLYGFTLSNGSRSLIANHVRSLPALSPRGGYALYFEKGNWQLFSFNSKTAKNITSGLDVTFANEENDLPASPAEYGWGGWMNGDSLCFLYDRYDIWAVDSRNAGIRNLTSGKGRKEKINFRIIKTDKESEFYSPAEPLLLSAFYEDTKVTSLFLLDVHSGKLSAVCDEPVKSVFKVKSVKSGSIIFTKERYDLFPDLWLYTDSSRGCMRLTDFGRQKDSFFWGKSRLISWRTPTGKKLDGVYIEPVNFQPGKRYPVLVYYYEIFSNSLYNFPDMVVNHRPNYPFYSGNGYGIFLPDVRFKVGKPGPSAVECVTSGIKKLIELGLADEKAVGLHGHSWSGYQTAYIVTATDMFAAACAGAPVSNMTSAYSGIRSESGMARQFQYEKAQSRIGASLWADRQKYIANSPLFFADRIHTPLLLMHGDEDEAVPWQQSIEFYMALRRLQKPVYFLQYRGEPHHPKKYANKVDYTIRMKAFFDHYLKGNEMPEWMKNGMPYKE